MGWRTGLLVGSGLVSRPSGSGIRGLGEQCSYFLEEFLDIGPGLGTDFLKHNLVLFCESPTLFL